jgi:hypothetical protein
LPKDRVLPRLNLFAKGNLDVRDTLHALTLDGEVRWNGVNTLLREANSDTIIRVRHETSTGSAMALVATGSVPPGLAERLLPLGPHSLAAQFGSALFEAAPNAFVLSIQGDVQFAPARHRDGGYLFYPHGAAGWPQSDRDWLAREFVATDLPPVDAAMADLAAVIERLRAASEAPVLVYNMSAVVPGEGVYCHAGLGDIFSTRIRRFNLALIELSQQTGISIVDVDRLFAEAGAGATKFDTIHFTPLGCRIVAAEVLRILGDYGLVEMAEAG